MNRRLVLTVLALNVVTNEIKVSTSQPLTPSNSTPATFIPPAPTTSCVCKVSTSCSSPTQPESPPPALGVIKVKWEEKSCKGDVHLSLLSSHSLPVCFNSLTHRSLHRAGLCKRKGCEGSPTWTKINPKALGYQISTNGSVANNPCTTLGIQCEVSDKRQSRWIGPTQSQSVSYHRGKAGLQLNDNTDKRHSYPGLERLTVNTSREPSSNRNSDYDSYNL
ncbi:uncharacterized protein cd5 isoform X2 [Oncorhynchus kisutch]|uniref:uncharacterized protein cd5 isoform X2 n=1 Tax=Oncorhynchus kisutch TaxID=8019 RepID=UPI0012DF3FC0|nr:uncharacterized protein LOC109900441 isoform X2 [Oncorhynchus kisutch]